MNIIVDEATHKGLQQYILDTIEFGSAMTGNVTADSDHDYLHIIETSKNWVLSPYNTNHLLQYRDGDDDHIYCTRENFVKSLIDGDATIFHEILRAGALKGTCLEAISDIKFDHYKTLRAYIGLARRDLKEATKLFKKDNRKARKKFKFALDALNYVWYTLTPKVSSFEYHIADDISASDFIAACMNVVKRVDNTRTHISNDFNFGNIPRTITIEELDLCQEFCSNVLDDTTYCMSDYEYGLNFFRDSHIQGN